MSCPGSYFLNKHLGLCYRTCPAGYTNTAGSCFRGVPTLGMSSMRCRRGERRSGPRCVPTGTPCGSGRQLWGSRCYRACPPTAPRTAVSTCVHRIKRRGNTHLWVANQALALLSRATLPAARAVAAALNVPACRKAWEEGLWGEDQSGRADNPLSKDRFGTHFYNARGVDYEGKRTGVTTYDFLGQKTDNSALREMNKALGGVGRLTSPSTGTCRAIGAALHYVTDMMPLHTSGFSGASQPLLLHSLLDFYVPTVQGRYPAAGAWSPSGPGRGGGVNGAFRDASVRANKLAPALLRALGAGDGICTISGSGLPYTGRCFPGDARVDREVGNALRLCYETTATWVIDLFGAAV